MAEAMQENPNILYGDGMGGGSSQVVLDHAHIREKTTPGGALAYLNFYERVQKQIAEEGSRRIPFGS